jgi:threonyl-tRNA synthetase
VREFYEAIDVPLKVRLSFRDDSDNYLGDASLWERSQGIIKEVVEEAGLEYYEGIGEAAFYGPKIDFMATDALGRELQVATPQLDFVQPDRFKLKYTDQDGTEKTPVMIHFALLGSIERFLAVYIEHTAGKFPVWLSPEQVRIVTVNQEKDTVAFAEKIAQQAKGLGIRVHIDNDNESVGKKIRSSEVWKVPYTVVIGENEIKVGKLKPRIRKDWAANDKQSELSVEDFLKAVADEAKTRSGKSSL